MKTTLALVFATILCGPAWAVGEGEAQTPVEIWQEDRTIVLDADDVELSDFQWIARPVVVFADSTADPRFIKQLDLLAARAGELADRDVVVITDTDPAEKSALRTELRPRGFMLVLIGKDGGVKLRKPAPWNVRELTRVIDKTPERQQEVRDRALLAE
ncbi:MAG: DUF4174 domain-containing protein [Rhodobacteraceae bacterium]|nr:DUF4174 domain-containing protein [Paracoccaceae bacterium]